MLRPILPYLTKQYIELFWNHIDRRSNNECWPWIDCKDKRGYGIFLRWRAHRVAFVISTGKDTELYICHHCDYPSCVNPAHLFEGTPADNIADMVSKGRKKPSPPHNPARGQHNTNAKLTDAQALEIRNLYTDVPRGPKGLRRQRGIRPTYKQTSDKYGVSHSTIQHIVYGLIWRHVK